MGTEVSDQTAERIDGHQAMGPEADAAVGQMVARLFAHWRLDAHDQAALLGQPVESSCSLPGHEFVSSNETAERMGHLLAIHANLRSLFPQNRDLAHAWMGTGNKAFDGLTPVAVVRTEGLVGLRTVRAYLDRAVGA